VQIIETLDGSVTSTKQFVWDSSMRESRDGDGDLLNQYFACGQTISGDNYYYTQDHIGSIRELTDGSGNIQAQYQYDSYGRVSQLEGSLASDFQYAGYYFHAPSGLNLTVHRAYSSSFGRWINRDIIGERGGINLYDYVENTPVCWIDPSGLFHFDSKTCCQIESEFKMLAEDSNRIKKEIGVPFNIDDSGTVDFGPVEVGNTPNGPVHSKDGYANVGMTHVGIGAAWDGSGFKSTDIEQSLTQPGMQWTVNDSGNIFVLEKGHMYEIEKGCKKCWDLGSPGHKQFAGTTPCP
jgi:RHS repeat-associated protein